MNKKHRDGRHKKSLVKRRTSGNRTNLQVCPDAFFTAYFMNSSEWNGAAAFENILEFLLKLLRRFYRKLYLPSLIIFKQKRGLQLDARLFGTKTVIVLISSR